MGTPLLGDLSLGPVGLAIAAAMVATMLVLAILSVRFQVLTATASVTAAVLGIAFLVLGGIPYLAVMLFFVFEGAVVTRYRLSEKQAQKVGEGKQGERGVANVLAHTVIPLILVLPIALPGTDAYSDLAPFLFTAAISFGAADTFASEIGVLAPGAVSILGFAPVKPGTNGGISLRGELAALGATLLTAAFGFLAFWIAGSALAAEGVLWLLGIALAGWLGCQVDSVVGASAENRGWIGKSSVNLIGMAATVGIAAGWLLLVPFLPGVN